MAWRSIAPSAGCRRRDGAGVGIGATGGQVHGEPQLAAVIVGDSLTGGNVSYIAPTLASSGLRVRLEGLGGCPDPIEFAGARIDELLDVLGPDTATAWVTVADRSRWDTTRAFNEALAQRASTLPNLSLIRWGQLATPHPEWFEDHVHPTHRGLAAFTQMYIDGIRKLLDQHPMKGSLGNGLRRAHRLGPG